MRWHRRARMRILGRHAAPPCEIGCGTPMRIPQLACVMVIVSASCAGIDDAATPQPAPSAPVPASGGEGMPDPVVTPPPPITPVVPPTVVSGTWTQLADTPLQQAGYMLLMTDGTVLV